MKTKKLKSVLKFIFVKNIELKLTALVLTVLTLVIINI